MSWNDFLKLRLRNAPKPVKALTLGYLLALSCAYFYAILNIALIVGLTPKDIAIHYYGSATPIEKIQKNSGEESFSLDEVTEEKKESTPIAQPSLKNLVTEGHFHLFGMTSFFFGLTVLVLFTGISNRFKSALAGLPYVLIVLDNLSFMATRFIGPKLSYLTAISGGLMGLIFLANWAVIGLETLRKDPTK